MELSELLKRCATCSDHKPASHFTRDAKNKDGLRYSCRPCRVISTRNWKLANPQMVIDWKATPSAKANKYAHDRRWILKNRERSNSHKRAWAKKNPFYGRLAQHRRRCKKIQNGVSVINKRDLLYLRQSECVFCQTKKDIVLDHIIPISRGGRHSIRNLQPLCKSCNSKKSDKYMVEFRFYMLGVA